MWVYLVQQLHRAGDEVERLKGSRIYKHHFLPGKSHYNVLTNEGYRFKIHCEDVLFICEYKNGLWPTKHWTAFRVYCEFFGTIPESYTRHLREAKFLPCLGSWWTSREFKRKTAIKVYLDTILTA